MTLRNQLFIGSWIGVHSSPSSKYQLCLRLWLSPGSGGLRVVVLGLSCGRETKACAPYFSTRQAPKESLGHTLWTTGGPGDPMSINKV